ncbi:Carnosine synthase 1 [Perkinsus olseni]|uniref:Carnosine synthase 1 n=1 Tax=Perkinsus olseni TaxID=32597 RepID=A0A7J6PDJ9_PEROL|nr:Carnosine synthase 1 [Perkinsus olseni]
MDEALQVARNRPDPGTWASPRTSRPTSADVTCKAEELSLEDYAFELSGFDSSTTTTTHFDTDMFSGGARHPAVESRFYSEQILDAPGSLRTPMSEGDRRKVVEDMIPTATYKMLRKIPPEILSTTGPSGDALRMQLLKGACIVFFSAGYPGKRFVYETAERLGVKSVIIDSPGSWAEALLAEGVIAKFVPIDMTQDSKTVFDLAYKAILGLKDDPLVLVARLAESLGMRGPSPAAVDTVRDKYRMREALQKRDLPGVKHYLIRSVEDLDHAASHVGFPAVMKPVSGAASLGVEKVTSRDELFKVYGEVQDLLSKLVINSGALERDSVPVGPGATSNIWTVKRSTSTSFYLLGSVAPTAEYTTMVPTMEPYFAETWGVLPSALPDQDVDELKQLALQSLEATGFTEGVFHVEGKYTSRGPRLIEINARMGGGPLESQRFPIHDPNCSNGAVAWLAVNAPKSGHIPDFAFLKQWLDWPHADVKISRPMVAEGEKIVGPEDGQPSWLVDIIFVASNPSEATHLAAMLYREVEQECVKHYG